MRYAGVSNFSLAQLRPVQAVHPVASLQPPYSMLVRGVEAELLPYCAANRIGVGRHFQPSPLQEADCFLDPPKVGFRFALVSGLQGPLVFLAAVPKPDAVFLGGIVMLKVRDSPP